MKLFAAVAAVGLIVLSLAGSPTEATTIVKFGARAGRTVSAYQAYETRVHHQVADARLYYRWNQPFPDATAAWARDNGRQVFLSVFPRRTDGTPVLWKDIAAAQPGSAIYAQMLTWATEIKDFNAPVLFSFNHEPEAKASSGLGTPAEYQSAWQKFITVLRAQGVVNAEYVFIGTSYGYGRGRTQLYYPGDSYVDAIGADAYNWYTCRPGIANPWFSMKNLVDRMMSFANNHPTKSLMLPEFGTTEDPGDSSRKAQWYLDAEELFKTPPYDRFVLINEYDTQDACAFRPDSSATSLTAFATWLNDPYYAG
ncbi:MAG: glycosyl hydrolase [Nocardioidaceae bacterium]